MVMLARSRWRWGACKHADVCMHAPAWVVPCPRAHRALIPAKCSANMRAACRQGCVRQGKARMQARTHTRTHWRASAACHHCNTAPTHLHLARSPMSAAVEMVSAEAALDGLQAAHGGKLVNLQVRALAHACSMSA